MLGRIRQFLNSQEGSIAPLTAIMLPMILGLAGFGIDTGVWVKTKRNLQTAADAAVIAAAWEIIYDNEENAEAAAL